MARPDVGGPVRPVSAFVGFDPCRRGPDHGFAHLYGPSLNSALNSRLVGHIYREGREIDRKTFPFLWNVDLLSRVITVENISAPLGDKARVFSCRFVLTGRIDLRRPGGLFGINACINNPIVRRHFDPMLAQQLTIYLLLKIAPLAPLI